MTAPQSLSERLRSSDAVLDGDLLDEAADAHDAMGELIKRQSAEIGRLVAVTLHCAARDVEVERQAALLAQAAAALEKIANLIDSEAGEPLDDAIDIAREALAAIRKKEEAKP